MPEGEEKSEDNVREQPGKLYNLRERGQEMDDGAEKEGRGKRGKGKSPSFRHNSSTFEDSDTDPFRVGVSLVVLVWHSLYYGQIR